MTAPVVRSTVLQQVAVRNGGGPRVPGVPRPRINGAVGGAR